MVQTETWIRLVLQAPLWQGRLCLRSAFAHLASALPSRCALSCKRWARRVSVRTSTSQRHRVVAVTARLSRLRHEGPILWALAQRNRGCLGSYADHMADFTPTSETNERGTRWGPERGIMVPRKRPGTVRCNCSRALRGIAGLQQVQRAPARVSCGGRHGSDRALARGLASRRMLCMCGDCARLLGRHAECDRRVQR